jgi:hypothetical protein
MNNPWVKYSIYFVFIILLQGLVFNQIQFSGLVYPMVYSITIIMLPVETSLILSIVIATILGIGVDMFSDTFGLHTSSSVLIAYVRPTILKFLRPRDGYDNVLLLSIHDMGKTWFLTFATIIIGIHNLWFFTFELLRFDLIFTILLKSILSTIVTLFIIILLQYLLYKPTKR